MGNDHGTGSDAGNGSDSGAPTITLEVPGFNFGKCLSPIKELPSPMPTPIPSPIPFMKKLSHDEFRFGFCVSKISLNPLRFSLTKKLTQK